MMMQRIYLAARYSRRLELCEYRAQLESCGYVVTSKWLDGSHQISDAGKPIGDHGEALVEDGSDDRVAELRCHFAAEDFENVLSADTLIAFTEVPRSGHSRGGRHVEFGIALGLSRNIVVVGPRENVFCWLPQIRAFDSWGGYLGAAHVLTGHSFMNEVPCGQCGDIDGCHKPAQILKTCQERTVLA